MSRGLSTLNGLINIRSIIQFRLVPAFLLSSARKATLFIWHFTWRFTNWMVSLASSLHLCGVHIFSGSWNEPFSSLSCSLQQNPRLSTLTFFIWWSRYAPLFTLPTAFRKFSQRWLINEWQVWPAKWISRLFTYLDPYLVKRGVVNIPLVGAKVTCNDWKMMTFSRSHIRKLNWESLLPKSADWLKSFPKSLLFCGSWVMQGKLHSMWLSSALKITCLSI